MGGFLKLAYFRATKRGSQNMQEIEQRKSPRWRPDEDAQIQRLRQEGRTIPYIAVLVERTALAVESRLRRLRRGSPPRRDRNAEGADVHYWIRSAKQDAAFRAALRAAGIP